MYLMGPSRKRAKPNPPSTEEDLHKPKDKVTTPPAPSSSVVPNVDHVGRIGENASAAVSDMAPAGNNTTGDKHPSSWYRTWPRKSLASTQVARETILADKPTNSAATLDLTRFEPKKPHSPAAERPPSMYLGKSRGTLDVTMGGTTDGVDDIQKDTLPSQNAADTNSAMPSRQTVSNDGEALAKPPLAAEDIATQRPVTASGWLGGWLAKPVVQAAASKDGSKESPKASGSVMAEEPLPQPDQEGLATAAGQQENSPAELKAVATSWFGLWSTAPNPIAADEPKDQIPVQQVGKADNALVETMPASKPVAGSSWAFWSSETPAKSSDAATAPSETGQLAVTGEASQTHPQPAKTTNLKDTDDTRESAKTVTEAARAKAPKDKKESTKRGREQATELVSTSNTTQPEPPNKKATSSDSPAPLRTGPPNLIIPSVKSTYRLVENPSILQQIARLILHSQQQPVKHVFLTRDLPKIKTALAIGIHGLFPAPLLRTVIGQPTGTSIRFANHAAAAIRRWADKNKCSDCEIEKVALEGEGKIAERVDNLWKLLLNWIDHVRKADFILVACHSQGVPVAIMLVAKLIEFGVVTTGKISICAMAGASLGPFIDYKSRLFSGSAGELFEFADPESTVSKRYEDALRIVLNYGTKITFCGSIDDQLISMESAVFSTTHHPNIYRLVFVDGRIHAPDFLSHLVGFALKLRNLGVSDHGLIRELSAPLAGSLYTGEGHSRLYDDEKVYDLAIEFALETTTVSGVPLQTTKYEVPTNANPYILPWIMRGLLEEDFVKTELDSETTELLKQFDDWKPSTKVLKDVKYRLEAVRSKL